MSPNTTTRRRPFATIPFIIGAIAAAAVPATQPSQGGRGATLPR